MLPAPQVKLPPVTVRRKCLAKVKAVAKRYRIPPAHVTAHIRTAKAIAARREVYHYMLTELGLSRAMIAFAFNRDLRRVRASVIGGPPHKRKARGSPGTAGSSGPLLQKQTSSGYSSRPDYSRFDLLGQPLVTEAQRKHRVPSPVLEACQLLKLLVPNHPMSLNFRRRHWKGA